MSAAGLVLVCALELLGRNAHKLPRIEILDERPSGASVNAAAIADRRAGVIYLIASSPPFRAAQLAQSSRAVCLELDSLRLVASMIVHEEWHLKHGPDERGAYYAQLMELKRLGVDPDRWPYMSVQRAMQTVLAAQSKRRADSGMAYVH